MAMGQWRYTVTLDHLSGNPEDSVMNVWHFNIEDTNLAANVLDVQTKVHDFYQQVSRSLSSSIDKQHIIHRLFDLREPRPRLPKYELETDIRPTADPQYKIAPRELACVLSFGSQAVSGTPGGRRRGRIFIGPLDLWTGETGSFEYIQTTALNRLVSAGGVLLGASLAATGWKWCVHSRYDFGGLDVGESPPPDQPFPEDPTRLASSFRTVTHGWVDNAWDVQRRRGVDATLRTPLPNGQAKRPTLQPLPIGHT